MRDKQAHKNCPDAETLN